MESSAWTNDLLSWLNLHPGWGLVVVFVIAVFESLVLVGILLPGVVILFGMGALIGLGVLDLAAVWIATSSGGLVGDSISYFLGRRYRENLLNIWPFSRYPALMERGLQFFNQHGAKSVIAGRFIGPLRPIIPVVVGIMRLPPSRFFLADIPACVVWAPAFLLPGMLFGASLEVASEYTGRLTILLIILVSLLWLTWWLMRLAYEPLASRSARWLRHAIRWTWRHPVLGRITGPLLDPSRPDVLSIAALGLLLVVMFWVMLMLLFMSPFSSQPHALDQAVQALALNLRNHLADPVMLAIAQLSRWEVSLLSSAVVLLWLLGTQRIMAAVHWFVAIAGGWVLQTLLTWGLRAAPQVIELPPDAVLSPSSEMSLITVGFVFFAVMIARETRRKHRQWPYYAAALVIILLTLARLYLGLEWLSGVLMGIMLGLVWTLVVGIAYRQRASSRFSAVIAGLIFYGSVALLMGWQASQHVAGEAEALQTELAKTSMPMNVWWQGGWQELPQSRTRRTGQGSRRFNAQVAADPGEVAPLLAADGWEQVPESGWMWMLQALNPRPDETSLPLLGRAFHGHSEVLLMRRNDPSTHQLVTVRLWDSGVRLEPGGQAVYLAQVAEERLVQKLRFFSYWRAAPFDVQQMANVRQSLATLQQKPVSAGLLLVREPAQAD